eukprot:221175_1
MCPTILLCLIILSLMSVWYKVQILDIDDSTCLIWNHARYSVPGYELENKNGLQCTRHNCNVRGCNASIYITWNDSVPQFRGKSDHDEWNNIKHSIHGHSDWGGAALIRESAITSINMDISIGKSKSDAFHSYSLSHPHESYALSLRDISHRLTNVSDKYPSAPASVDSIATDLVSKPQWKGNYYTHVEFELADKLQDDTLEQGFKDLLLNGTPAQLESSMNEWKCEMATLIKKISLSYLAVSRFNMIRIIKLNGRIIKLLRKYLNDIKRMATEYLEPIWINHEARFARCEWNEYRREIRANNHAESMNNAVQKFLGVHPEFYLWLWKSKQFSATQLARWRRYHENGFQRKRKVKEHLKNLNLKDLW